MKQEYIYINKNEISYETLKLMQEHAKKYDYVSDKREFLKNISPYEQKLVLLETKNPYEVLNYLDELDLEKSRLILSQLNFSEISKVLSLFSSEDKEKFYATFSDLELVNQFIVQDKNAQEHIEDLSLDRKVDLLNSSDSKTVEASSKIYESIDVEDRKEVVENVSTADGMSALSEVSSYDEGSSVDTSEQTTDEIGNNQEVEQLNNLEQLNEKEEQEENLEQQEKEEQEEKLEIPKEEKTEEETQEEKNLEEIITEEKNVEENENLDEFDSQELLTDESNVSKLFQQAKEVCEQEIINAVLSNAKEDTMKEEVQKTL